MLSLNLYAFLVFFCGSSSCLDVLSYADVLAFYLSCLYCYYFLDAYLFSKARQKGYGYKWKELGEVGERKP